METKRVRFCGTVEEVETMVRIMDHIFRRWWNVYGGHRDASWHNEEGYNVVISYTASYIFYDLHDMFKVAWRAINRQHFIREEAYFTVVH